MGTRIAAMMVAAARATADGPLHGDVLVACVADEEHVSLGTEEVLESFTADAAIVTEPSHLEITVAHKGGDGPSTYPASCRVTIERRTVPGETIDRVEAELAGVLDSLTASVPDFRYRLVRGLNRGPFEADPDAAIVRTLTRHGREGARASSSHPRRAVLDGRRASRPRRHPVAAVRSRRRRRARGDRMGRSHVTAPPHRHPHRHDH